MTKINKSKKELVIFGGALLSYFVFVFVGAAFATLLNIYPNYGSSLADVWIWLFGLVGSVGYLLLYFFKLEDWLFPDKKKNIDNHFWDYSKFDKSKKFILSTDSKAWGWVVESKILDDKSYKKVKRTNSLVGVKGLKTITNEDDNIKNRVVYRMMPNSCINLLGTPRSGKTQQIILTTIVANAKSKVKPIMFITDPKMELCRLTTKILKDNQYDVFIFNIKDPNVSNYFNFLSSAFVKFKEYLINKSKNEEIALKARNSCLTELDTIITMLIVPSGKGDDTERYFATQGKELFLAFATLYLEEIEKHYDLTGEIVDNYFNLPSLFKSCNEFSREEVTSILKHKKSLEKDWRESYNYMLKKI